MGCAESELHDTEIATLCDMIMANTNIVSLNISSVHGFESGGNLGKSSKKRLASLCV